MIIKISQTLVPFFSDICNACFRYLSRSSQISESFVLDIIKSNNICDSIFQHLKTFIQLYIMQCVILHCFYLYVVVNSFITTCCQVFCGVKAKFFTLNLFYKVSPLFVISLQSVSSISRLHSLYNLHNALCVYCIESGSTTKQKQPMTIDCLNLSFLHINYQYILQTCWYINNTIRCGQNTKR